LTICQLQRSTIVFFGVGLLSAVLIGLAYWIICIFMQTDEPMSIRILYRYGDTDYLPFIYALARFNVHEFATLSNLGVLPFPLLFFAPHAAMIALFGDWGFAAADALVTATWFILFFLLAKVSIEHSRPATVIGLAMLVATGPWGWTGVLPAGWEEGLNDLGYAFDVWSFRYSRPFIAGLSMLAWSSRPARSPQALSKDGPDQAFMLSMACCWAPAHRATCTWRLSGVARLLRSTFSSCSSRDSIPNWEKRSR
jgi:hypothetical protein